MVLKSELLSPDQVGGDYKAGVIGPSSCVIVVVVTTKLCYRIEYGEGIP